MSMSRWLNLKKFIFLSVLLIFTSILAVSDTVDDTTGTSSYGLTTDQLIFGFVGSSLLNEY